MFNVSCDFLINLHHNIDGNSSSHMHRPEIVWFLKVLIALSAAFTLWSYGVTNCTFMFSLSRYIFIALVDTLSMKLYTGLNPLFDNYVMFFLKHLTIVSAFASFIGVARIALDVQSYMINISFMPCIDVMGNFPVNSAYIVPSFLSTYPNVMELGT